MFVVSRSPFVICCSLIEVCWSLFFFVVCSMLFVLCSLMCVFLVCCLLFGG